MVRSSSSKWNANMMRCNPQPTHRKSLHVFVGGIGGARLNKPAVGFQGIGQIHHVLDGLYMGASRRLEAVYIMHTGHAAHHFTFVHATTDSPKLVLTNNIHRANVDHAPRPDGTLVSGVSRVRDRRGRGV